MYEHSTSGNTHRKIVRSRPTTPNTKQERLIDEYINRWYLSEDGDSDVLKESSKLEMKRQLKSILTDTVTGVLDELVENEVIEGAGYYIPNSPDDTYTTGDVVRVSAIEQVRREWS